MDEINPKESKDKELRIQAAIIDIQNQIYKSSRKVARAYNIPDSTLRNRMAGRNTRKNSRESQQILSNIEEKTLVRWITRLTCAGFPASPSLVMQLQKYGWSINMLQSAFTIWINLDLQLEQINLQEY